MTAFGRRRFIGTVGALAAIAATMTLFVDQSRSDWHGSRLLARLRIEPGWSSELTALGRAVNSQSPASSGRVSVLVESRPGEAVDLIIVEAANRETTSAIVAIDGWRIPDLVAGVAGVLAAEAE